MRPVKTATANLVYRGDGESVGDLACERIAPGVIRSWWEPDDFEREVIAEGGRVALTVFTEPIPPVHLHVVAEIASHPVEGDE